MKKTSYLKRAGLTQEEITLACIERFKKIHGEVYDYSKFKYEKATEKAEIICKEHGSFWKTPNDHHNGKGCTKCSSKGRNKYSNEEYLEKLIGIHGDTFNYSKVKYTGSNNKVIIICKEHGEFKRAAVEMLQGKGCNKCTLEKQRIFQEGVFLKRAQEVHGDKYDYSKIKYVNSSTKMIIICKEHGEFLQTRNNHLSGAGCKKCWEERKKLSIEDFKKKATKKHKGLYDYSKVQYEKTTDKVTIICPIHGEFKQTVNAHVSGNGCKWCNGLNSFERAERYKEKWQKQRCNVYFLRFTNNEEEFYKIGITKETVDDRFRYQCKQYNIEILKYYETNKYNAAILENVIKEENEHYSYIPKHKFRGYTECFSKNILI